MNPNDPTGTDYYLKFGLARDPFPPAMDDVLYLTPGFHRRLQRIKEAITSTQKLVLVSSSPGAGKSTLADYLETSPEDNWRISLIQAEPGMSSEALAFALTQQALPDKVDKPAVAVPMLHKYLELSSRSGFLPVFIIDEADRLPQDTLKFVLELATLRYTEALFRIVLFADDTLVDQLEDPALSELASELVHNLHLPSLSRLQTREYLDIRLQAAGERGDYAFTDDQIEYIYRVSGGLPAGINLAARETMQHVKIAEPETPAAPAHNNYGKIAASIAVIAAIGISAYVYLSQEPAVQPESRITAIEPVNTQAEQPAVNEPEPVSETAMPAVVAPPAEISTDTGVDNVPVMDMSAGTAIMETAAPTPAVSTEPVIETVPEVTTPTAAPEQPVPVDTVVTPQSTAASVQTVALTTPVRPYTFDETNIYNLDSVPEIITGIRGNNWYRSQAKTAYTLQLISASNIDNVVELLEDAPGNQPDLSGYVKYTPSGKPRYLMFYGLYADKDSANAAIESLPAALRAVNPWPRSIGNITDEIDMVIAAP